MAVHFTHVNSPFFPLPFPQLSILVWQLKSNSPPLFVLICRSTYFRTMPQSRTANMFLQTTSLVEDRTHARQLTFTARKSMYNTPLHFWIGQSVLKNTGFWNHFPCVSCSVISWVFNLTRSRSKAREFDPQPSPHFICLFCCLHSLLILPSLDGTLRTSTISIQMIVFLFLQRAELELRAPPACTIQLRKPLKASPFCLISEIFDDDGLDELIVV